MKVPIFRAKDIDSNKVVEGFYFNYPETNHRSVIGGSEADQASHKHCLITYRPMQVTDSSAVPSTFGPAVFSPLNEPVGCDIDINTLEFVRFEEVSCIGET